MSSSNMREDDEPPRARTTWIERSSLPQSTQGCQSGWIGQGQKNEKITHEKKMKKMKMMFLFRFS